MVVFVGQSGDVLILESHAGGSVSLRQFGLNAEQLSFIELGRGRPLEELEQALCAEIAAALYPESEPGPVSVRLS